MIKVTFVENDGTVREITDAEEGHSLMEVAKANDVVGITADCGGGCSCATCHVYVDPEWRAQTGEPDDIEMDMLDMTGDIMQEGSRLSCQIKLTEALNGLKVKVAPTE